MKHSTLKNIVLPGIFCAACLGGFGLVQRCF